MIPSLLYPPFIISAVPAVCGDRYTIPREGYVEPMNERIQYPSSFASIAIPRGRKINLHLTIHCGFHCNNYVLRQRSFLLRGRSFKEQFYLNRLTRFIIPGHDLKPFFVFSPFTVRNFRDATVFDSPFK